MSNFKVMTTEQLQNLMSKQMPDYKSASDGYILVNTLPREHFQKEHIVNSINVPEDSLEVLADKFDKIKNVIVYCANAQCSSSKKSAEKLVELGFSNVQDFEDGLEAWKQAGGEVKSGKEKPTVEDLRA